MNAESSFEFAQLLGISQFLFLVVASDFVVCPSSWATNDIIELGLCN